MGRAPHRHHADHGRDHEPQLSWSKPTTKRSCCASPVATRSCWASTGRPSARPVEPRRRPASARRSTRGSRTSAVWSPGSSRGTSIPEADLQREDGARVGRGFAPRVPVCPPISSEFPVFRLVESYRRIASDRGVKVPGAYDDAHEVAARIEASFDAAPMTPGHVPQRPAERQLPLGRRPRVDRRLRVRGDGRSVLRPGEPRREQRPHATGAGDAALVCTSDR